MTEKWKSTLSDQWIRNRSAFLTWVVLHLLILLPFSKLADVQLFALGALPFLFLYNGQRGQGNRWLFYLFYCVHIPLLYGLAQLL